MSLLLPVILKTACPSTHPRLAIDALRFLRGDSPSAWRDLLLKFHRPLLAGAVAPDNEFKDFQNHVLYAGRERFGGAQAAARQWYDKTVAALAAKDWHQAAFAAGVLSHYVSEPFFPLNTRQSDAGSRIQLAVEWSVNRSYGRMQTILDEDLGGYPAVEIPAAADGIEQAITAGAQRAGEHYDAIVGHFDLSRALVDPDEALDQELQDTLAACLGSAVVCFARFLERAIVESAAAPPKIDTSVSGLTAFLKSPFRVLAGHTWDQLAQRKIETVHEEFQLTGRVDESLPEEQREVRRLYVEQVPSAVAAAMNDGDVAVGTLYGQGAHPRFRSHRLRSEPIESRHAAASSTAAGEPVILSLRPASSASSPIENAPGIGKSLAVRLRRAGIDTIGDLLAADPEFLADRLRLRGQDRSLVEQWQSEVRQVEQPKPAEARPVQPRRAA